MKIRVYNVKKERGPWVEEFAMNRGHTHFYYDMHCIETHDDEDTSNTLTIPQIFINPNLEPSGFVSEPQCWGS